MRKLLELAEFDPGTAVAVGAASGTVPNQLMNGDGGRGNWKLKI